MCKSFIHFYFKLEDLILNIYTFNQREGMKQDVFSLTKYFLDNYKDLLGKNSYQIIEEAKIKKRLDNNEIDIDKALDDISSLSSLFENERKLTSTQFKSFLNTKDVSFFAFSTLEGNVLISELSEDGSLKGDNQKLVDYIQNHFRE